MGIGTAVGGLDRTGEGDFLPGCCVTGVPTGGVIGFSPPGGVLEPNVGEERFG